jgi:hypothetical protein
VFFAKKKSPVFNAALFRTNHQHRRWSMVWVLSANCLGTDGWGTPLINGAPFTNAPTFTMQMALSGIDSIDSTKSHNNQNPAQNST